MTVLRCWSSQFPLMVWNFLLFMDLVTSKRISASPRIQKYNKA
jgi:hypothetical protein